MDKVKKNDKIEKTVLKKLQKKHMNKPKKKPIKGLLMMKIVLILLLMGVLIYWAVLNIGRAEYDRSIKEYYNMVAYDAAKIARGYFKPGELSKYSRYAYAYNHGEASEGELKIVTEEYRYKEMLENLYKLRKSVEANDVFVIVLDVEVMDNYSPESFKNDTWKPIYYIADVYEDESLNYKLGDKGAILPEFRLKVMESYVSGEAYDGFFISQSPFGYNLTAMLPVVENGKSVAFVCVEIPMKTLETNKALFTERVSISSSVIVILMVLIIILFVHRMIILPVELISKEADEFVDNKAMVSENLDVIRTRDEIQSLSDSVKQMQIDINEYISDIRNITAEKERIGAELSVANHIQSNMLPKTFPGRTEFDIYATMNPAKEVGGDFYDYFLIGENKLGMVMADVSGKGIPAALFMVIAKTLIKNRALMGESPAEVLGHVNNELLEGNEAGLFVTVWLAIVDLETGKGIAANAGHEHPALRHSGGQFELVKYRHSPAVATIEDMKYREHEFELKPGDTLFVYTDGVTEATNKDEKLFGEDRMIEALNRNPDAEPEVLLGNVQDGINEFVQDAKQFDDITMMGMIYKGK